MKETIREKKRKYQVETQRDREEERRWEKETELGGSRKGIRQKTEREK